MRRATQTQPFASSFIDWFGHEIRIVTASTGKGKMGLRARWYYSGELSWKEIAEKDWEMYEDIMSECERERERERLLKTG